MVNQYRLDQDYTKEFVNAMNNWNRAKPDKFITSEEKIVKAENEIEDRLRDYYKVTALEINQSKDGKIFGLALKVGRYNVTDHYFWEREFLLISENHYNHYNKTCIMWGGAHGGVTLLRDIEGHPLKLKEIFSQYNEKISLFGRGREYNEPSDTFTSSEVNNKKIAEVSRRINNKIKEITDKELLEYKVIDKIQEMEPIAKMIYSIIFKNGSFNSSLKSIITNISEIMFNLFITSKKILESQSKEEISSSLNRLKNFVRICNIIPENFKKNLENMELNKKETTFVEDFLPLLEHFDFSGLYKALKHYHSHNQIKARDYYRKMPSSISKIHTLFLQIHIKTLNYKNIMQESIENAEFILEKLHNNISKASSIELEVLEILPPILEYIRNSIAISLYSEVNLIFYKDKDLMGYIFVLKILIDNIQHVLKSDDYILENSSRGYLVDLTKNLEQINAKIKLIKMCMEDLDPTISERKDIVSKTTEFSEKTLRYTRKSNRLINEELDRISVWHIKHSFSKPTMRYTLLSIIQKKRTAIIFEDKTLYDEILMFFQYLFQDLFEFTLSILPKEEFHQKKDRLGEVDIIHVVSPLEDERVMDNIKFSELARMIDNFYESSHEKIGEVIVLKTLKKDLENLCELLKKDN